MFSRIATALVEESVTATSGLPSPLKSPTATPKGPEPLPVLKVVAAENVPDRAVVQEHADGVAGVVGHDHVGMAVAVEVGDATPRGLVPPVL